MFFLQPFCSRYQELLITTQKLLHIDGTLSWSREEPRVVHYVQISATLEPVTGGSETFEPVIGPRFLIPTFFAENLSITVIHPHEWDFRKLVIFRFPSWICAGTGGPTAK